MPETPPAPTAELLAAKISTGGAGLDDVLGSGLASNRVYLADRHARLRYASIPAV